MIYFYYFFSAVLVFLSLRSFRGGLSFLEHIRSEAARTDSGHTPPATVIVPCRGLEEGLHENLSTLLLQDYPHYEVIFVLDSNEDPAHQEILSITKNLPKAAPRTKIIIAPPARGSSQKVENLREAVLNADTHSEIFVFTDSDTRTSPDWLGSMIAPLKEDIVGATTGYRWFISEQRSFASEIRSVWNASIASALGKNRKSNFCWGGSMAMRRHTFELLSMRQRWAGTLSDDFALTRAVKEAGLEIHFVPQALTASVGSCTFSELFEFTNRQMKITRVYATPLWLLSFFGSALFCSVMISSILIAALSPMNDDAVWVAIGVLAAVTALSIGKAELRFRAVKHILASRYPRVNDQRFMQNTLWLLSPALYLFNSIAALYSRRMTWRGITYELKSPSETVIISRKGC